MVWRNQTILTKSIASSKLQLKLPMGQKNFRRWDKRSVGVSTPKCTCLTLILTCRAAARILYQGDLKSDGREPMAGCTLSLIIIIMIMGLASVSTSSGTPSLYNNIRCQMTTTNDANHFGRGGLSRPLKLEGQIYQSQLVPPPEHVKFLSVEKNRCMCPANYGQFRFSF